MVWPIDTDCFDCVEVAKKESGKEIKRSVDEFFPFDFPSSSENQREGTKLSTLGKPRKLIATKK